MRTIQRDIVGAFIFSSDNKLLLGKSYKGGVYRDNWIVPGGGIDNEETPLDTIKREILEETGIDISNTKIEQIDGIFTGESEKTLRDTGERVNVQMKFYNFRVHLSEPATQIKTETADDFQDAKWYPTNELKNLVLSPPTVTTLKKLNFL